MTLLCQLSSLAWLHYLKGGKPCSLDEHDVFQDRETLPETLPSMDADSFTLQFLLTLSWHLQRQLAMVHATSSSSWCRPAATAGRQPQGPVCNMTSRHCQPRRMKYMNHSLRILRLLICLAAPYIAFTTLAAYSQHPALTPTQLHMVV